MRVMGAILAGGQARRFGSDKAQALIAGVPLMAHIISALSPQVEELIVVGRDWETLRRLDDAPAGVGPLGGLCAALHDAQARGYDAVVSAGCDVFPLPHDLVARLQRLAAHNQAVVVQYQWLLGLWPAHLAAALHTHLNNTQDYAIRHWMRVCGAEAVDIGVSFANINRPEDLAALNGSVSE